MWKPSKFKILLAKFKRMVGISKEIRLSNFDKQIIKFSKGHYNKFGSPYPYKGEWTESFKPLFMEVYGYDPNDYYQDYLGCTFCRLLEVFKKVADNDHMLDRKLYDTYLASFNKGICRDQDKPIERAISELFGAIQIVSYLDDYGIPRYNLKVEGETKIIKIKIKT